MPSPRRNEQLGILLKEELARLLDREMEFPEQNLVTITRVSISTDHQNARVFVSILGTDPRQALEILEKNVYHIQQLLNRRLRTRPIPKIRFEIDREEFRRERVERSLEELKRKGEL